MRQRQPEKDFPSGYSGQPTGESIQNIPGDKKEAEGKKQNFNEGQTAQNFSRGMIGVIFRVFARSIKGFYPTLTSGFFLQC